MKDIDIFAPCVDPKACPWLSDNNVIVNACTKCGTNWMLTVVHELRTLKKAHLRDFDDILDIAPWPELRHYRFEKKHEKYLEWGNQWNNTEFPFKIFKGHLNAFQYSLFGRKVGFPVEERSNIKLLIMIRNPEDSLISFKEFLTTVNPLFEEEFGIPSMTNVTAEQTFTFLSFAGRNSPLVPTFYASWLEVSHLKNILLLHYTDVFKNPRKYMKKIANFLEIQTNEEDIDMILERTSLKFMKKHNYRYRYNTGKNRHYKLVPGIVNKGGLSYQGLSSELKEKVLNFAKTYLNDNEVKKIYNGFE